MSSVILVSSKTNVINIKLNTQDTIIGISFSGNSTQYSSSIDDLDIPKIKKESNLSDLNQTYSKKVKKPKAKDFKEKDNFLLNFFEPTFSFQFPKNKDEEPEGEIVKDRRINKSIKRVVDEIPFNDTAKEFNKSIGEVLEEIKINKNKIKTFSDKAHKFNKQNFNATIISQRNLTKHEFLDKISKDKNLQKIYRYAQNLGFEEINKSIEVKYENGLIVTTVILLNNEKFPTYLVNYNFENLKDIEFKCNETSFLVNISKINNTIAFTFFGEDWGVQIDMLNYSIISEWGHHSCGYGECVGYCYSWFLTNPIIGWLCGGPCNLCVDILIASGGSPLTIPGCAICIGCMAGSAVGCFGSCAIDSCGYYPCFEDCNDRDGYYNSEWVYYCNGNDWRRKKRYYNFYCPSEYGPLQGTCDYDSYYHDFYIETCTYGCDNQDGCSGAITCYNDLECGTDGWVSNPYCSGGDVWQLYRTYDCHYSGTDSSYCTYSQNYQLKQECIAGTCDSGQCVGDYYCEEQYPDTPWWCDSVCAGCVDGESNPINDEYYICCPASGPPSTCCDRDGPFCDTSTGSCDICEGSVLPYECNNDCWSCGGDPNYELCCPASGDPEYCCYSALAVCMSDGTCCAPSAETCNNADDDCDGTIDSFNEGCGVGACAGGTRTCTTGSWGACSTAGESSDETCNNVDDDCDGSIDEDLSQECGTDTGVCVKGTQSCSAGNWGACGGSYVAPANETCNSIDDNCNGLVDEANVCGDYPNVTLNAPSDNVVFYVDEVIFNCSITDDVKLENVTLYHDINGSFMPNQTQSISGTSTSVTFNVSNIQQGHYKWNCYACDNDTHCSLGDEAYWFTVNEEGQITTFADGTFEKILTYNQLENQTVYIRIPKDASILNASAVITGYYRINTEHFYWINWTVPNTNFDGGVSTYEMYWTPDFSGLRMVNLTFPSKYNGTFTLNTAPENVTLTITHLTSTGPPSYAPINITINGQVVVSYFDTGSQSYVIHEWDITSYVQQGTNLIESTYGHNATTHYWIKRNEINSSFEIFPTDPIVFVNISATNQTNIWDYTGEFSGPENITNFEDELNAALNNCVNDSEGYCNISLILSSGSIGILNLSNIEIYYEYPDDFPNVTLISPNDNNISTTGNVTFNCSAADDKGLENITLYTNISGTWETNQTNNFTGTLNSTTFTINNIPDETKFIWNCLVYDSASQSAWGDTNYSINVSLPNTAPTIINLSQYPTSLYRGEDIEIRCAVNDNETDNSSLNVIIEYQNNTNSGYLNCNNLIYDSTNAWWKCNYTTNYSDDDLGTFDFRCNVSDGKLSSGWTTNTDNVTVLNNNPKLLACQDGIIYIDTLGSQIQIDLDNCSSDIEDYSSNLVYQINSQTNGSLIDCYVSGHNITCNNPTQHQYGYSYLEVQVNDTDGGTNISIPQIKITVKPLLDIDKFYIKNSTGTNMAWFGDLGDINLRGICTSQATCIASADSFIIRNNVGEVVSYINETGDLCIETGDCSDKSSNCNPTNDVFRIKNETGTIVSYIDMTGDLCLTGVLIENGNP